MKRTFGLFLGLCIYWCGNAAAQQGPSFSCAGVKQPWAVVICSDTELSQHDLNIGQFYQQLRDRLTGGEQLSLIDNQLNWVALVKAQCNIPESGPLTSQQISYTSSCAKDMFAKRSANLANGTWRDPNANFESGLDIETRSKVQQQLAIDGSYQGKPDGRFGPGMRKAIQLSELKHGMSTTGYVSPKLLSAIGLTIPLPTQSGSNTYLAQTPPNPGPSPAGGLSGCRSPNGAVVQLDSATCASIGGSSLSATVSCRSPNGSVVQLDAATCQSIGGQVATNTPTPAQVSRPIAVAPPVAAPPPPPAPTPVQAQPPAAFGNNDIDRIAKTASENEARFQRDYKGKTLAFYGFFDSLQDGFFGAKQLAVNVGDTAVHCYGDSGLAKKAIDWNSGDKLFVQGKIRDTIMGVLQIDNCDATKR